MPIYTHARLLPRLLPLPVVLAAYGAFSPAAQQSGAKRMQSVVEEHVLAGFSTSFRRLVTREESQGRTYEKRTFESPSVNGGTEVVLEVEVETVQVDPDTLRSMRRVWGRDADGHPKLIRTVEEMRSLKPDGGGQAVRNYSEIDLNGRSQLVRREVEKTVAQGGGVFQTRTDVLLSDLNRSGLTLSERIELREQRRDGEVVEADQTRYRRTERGGWEALERHVTQKRLEGGATQSDEQVYSLDEARRLSLSGRTVSREWEEPSGAERKTVETYSRDIPGQARSSEPQLLRRISQVRSERSDGLVETVREVEERRFDKMTVVEKVIERTRPDSQGGTVTEREVFRLDANGRLMLVDRSF